MMKAVRVWIGGNRILKARCSDGREGKMKKKEEKKDGKEEDCPLGNKMSKLTIVKKRKNKHLKSLIKSNLAERLTIIMIISPKKKLQ